VQDTPRRIVVQVILSHTPFKQLVPRLHDKTVLLSGRHDLRVSRLSTTHRWDHRKVRGGEGRGRDGWLIRLAIEISTSLAVCSGTKAL